MKINNVNNFINYSNKAKQSKQEGLIKNKNYDVIQISKRTNKIDDTNNSHTINKIKNNMVEDIKKDTDVEKLDQLKGLVQENKYNVNAEELADILLRR